jgi:cell division protease FtsH
LTLLFNVLPFLLIAWIFWQIFRQAQRGTTQIFTFGKSGIKVYNPDDPNKVTFKDVANLEEAKQELMEVVEFLKNPDKFLKIGAKIPKGVLLVGPPGSGKTLLARSVAAEAGVPFFYISGSEFVEMFVGVGSARVRDSFAVAKRNQPSILFIDEIDAIGKVRGVGITGGHEEREQTLNQILVEMDGFEKGTRVVVLAATNRPDVLDPALLRPGRFDRKIVLDLPDIKAREEILKIHLRDKKVGKINLRQIAERTPGFSGADLANLCNEAAILAARRNKEFIEQEDLLDSIEKVLLGPERKTKVYSKKEKEIAAYHEAGHALVAHYLPFSSPVQKISIIARGRAGGYTLKTPLEERSFYFKKEFLDELASMLGGYAAEKLIFNDVTTGASNDLEIATDLAKQLVLKFGMSEKLGPISFSKPPREFSLEKEYSEKTAELIDEEVKNIINQALERALKVLEIKKDKLEKVAQVLIKKEVIEKRQFERLVGEKKGTLQI